MTEKVEQAENTDSEEQSEKDLREELYDQFDISTKGRLGIQWILPLLERSVQTESRYDVDRRSKILAEISLFQAYEQEPKFKMFVWAAVLIGSFDLLHPLNPGVYSVLFIALATINGFVSSLRSPAMMAAELEGATDEDGMPADYRAKALSSVNTNVTLVLFVIAVGIQLLVTSGYAQGEVVAQNLAEGMVSPYISAVVLFSIPLVSNRVRGGD
ncbi:hypothetical protein [Haloarchaeobius sp. DT45]|uniref:hypothetical protein n=1 Tax=Haloarchaeobius sp. DT45 TaxID=3446116 RepID=UPI003F6C90AB